MSQQASRAAQSCLGRKVPELPILFCTSMSQGSSTEIPFEPRWFKASWKCCFPLYLFFWERWSRGTVNPVKLLQGCHWLLSKGASQLPKAHAHANPCDSWVCLLYTGYIAKACGNSKGNLMVFLKKIRLFFSLFSFLVKWRIILEDYHEVVNRHWNKTQDIWVPFPALFAARFFPKSFQLFLPLLV